MQNLIEQLQKKAEELDTNISDVCRQLKMDRSFIERWKVKLPTALTKYFKIEEYFAGLEQHKAQLEEEVQIEELTE